MEARRSDGDVLEISRRNDFHTRIDRAVGKIRDNEIHLVAFEQVNAFDGGLIGDENFDVRIMLVKILQIIDQIILADGVADPDVKTAAFSVAISPIFCSP